MRFRRVKSWCQAFGVFGLSTLVIPTRAFPDETPRAAVRALARRKSGTYLRVDK